MIDLRTKISDAAKKNGLPDRGFGTGYGKRGGYGPGYGRGHHMGWGGGVWPGYTVPVSPQLVKWYNIVEVNFCTNCEAPLSRRVYMVVRILTLIFLFSVLISLPAIFAQPWRHGMYDRYERRPYGQSCPGMRGDPYGARKQVRTMEEAKQTLEQYLEGSWQEGSYW